MAREWNRFQVAIFKDVERGKGHTVVQARAGTGKTSTLMEALYYVPRGLTVLMVAFNKAIAKELQARAPDDVEVATLHSFGYRAVNRYLGRQQVNQYRVHGLAEDLHGDGRETSDLRYALVKGVSLAKGALLSTIEQIDTLIDTFMIDVGGYHPRVPSDAVDDEFELAAMIRLEFCRDVLALMEQCKQVKGEIDFDDMIWLPVVHKLKVFQYDRVFIDECLPGATPVLLADGSSKTIAEIVEGKLKVKVLAYNTRTGKQEACSVTAWHKLANQKPLVKIKAKWNRLQGTNKPTNFVICTVDHPVWADGKWIMAGDVRPGMTVQIETSAAKSQVGKITSRGRKRLRREMLAKNDSGVCGGALIRSKPPVRGGNGKGMTVPEQMLAKALGPAWMPTTVTTGKPRGSGYPHHYKIDLAHTGCKVAVEVDGQSHHALVRREQDRKKEKLLRSLGWTVIRVPNREAVQNATVWAKRIQGLTNCPIDAVVESVDPVAIPDYFVYDISVAHCHNFYANGILVHNCQDLNACQIELALGAVKKNGRITAVGDDRQAIYAFRGADKDALKRIVDRLNAKVLPLSVCYRCGTEIVKFVQQTVPDFEPAPNMPPGEVLRISKDSMIDGAAPGDFVLSRSNAPLVSLCMHFLAQNRRAHIQGRDIGSKLKGIVIRSKSENVPELREAIDSWERAEVKRLLAKKPPRDTQQVEDMAMCLMTLSEGAASVADVISRIEELFADNDDTNRIVLSTTHKAKGLERDRVWVLAGTYRRRPGTEEENLWYVATTRGKSTLCLVSGFALKKKDQDREPEEEWEEAQP